MQEIIESTLLWLWPTKVIQRIKQKEKKKEKKKNAVAEDTLDEAVHHCPGMRKKSSPQRCLTTKNETSNNPCHNATS